MAQQLELYLFFYYGISTGSHVALFLLLFLDKPKKLSLISPCFHPLLRHHFWESKSKVIYRCSFLVAIFPSQQFNSYYFSFHHLRW